MFQTCIYITSTGVAVPEGLVAMPAPLAPVTLPDMPYDRPIEVNRTEYLQ